MIDARLRGTKCEHCLNSHDFILDNTAFMICADCKDRPNRNKDKSRFTPDVKNEWLKELLDDDAMKGSPMDF